MATKQQRVKVGAFLVICTGIMAVTVAFLAGFVEDNGVEYWIEFNESVLGLTDGGMVQYLGVPVGKVKNIQVTSDSHARVTLTVDPARVTLYRGTQAKLVLYSFAAGTMAIGLEGGDPKQGVLPPNSIIPAKPSTITAVSERLESMMGDLDNIVTSLRTGLVGIEEGQLTRMIEDAEDLLNNTNGLITDGREFVAEANETLRDVRDQLEPVLARADEITANLDKVMTSTDEFLQTARAKIDPLELEKTEEDLQHMLRQVGDLSARINTIAEGFDATAEMLLHNTNNVQYAITQGIEQMTAALQRLRSLVVGLEEDPTAIVRGRGTPKALQ